MPDIVVGLEVAPCEAWVRVSGSGLALTQSHDGLHGAYARPTHTHTRTHIHTYTRGLQPFALVILMLS